METKEIMAIPPQKSHKLYQITETNQNNLHCTASREKKLKLINKLKLLPLVDNMIKENLRKIRSGYEVQNNVIFFNCVSKTPGEK